MEYCQYCSCGAMLTLASNPDTPEAVVWGMEKVRDEFEAKHKDRPGHRFISQEAWELIRDVQQRAGIPWPDQKNEGDE